MKLSREKSPNNLSHANVLVVGVPGVKAEEPCQLLDREGCHILAGSSQDQEILQAKHVGFLFGSENKQSVTELFPPKHAATAVLVSELFAMQWKPCRSPTPMTQAQKEAVAGHVVKDAAEHEQRNWARGES